MASSSASKKHTGFFKVVTLKENGERKNSYYVKLNCGIIRDCAPELREVWLDVHYSYLLNHLRKVQGETTIERTGDLLCA